MVDERARIRAHFTALSLFARSEECVNLFAFKGKGRSSSIAFVGRTQESGKNCGRWLGGKAQQTERRGRHQRCWRRGSCKFTTIYFSFLQRLLRHRHPTSLSYTLCGKLSQTSIRHIARRPFRNKYNRKRQRVLYLLNHLGLCLVRRVLLRLRHVCYTSNTS